MEMSEFKKGITEESYIDRDPEVEAEAEAEKKHNRDFNSYATNKNIAQGLLDFALLSTNISQMKYILQVGTRHPYYYLLVVVIAISFFLQVVVGILLLILGNRSSLKSRTSKLNYIITIIIFLITVMNVVISGFNMEVTGPSIEACKRYLTHHHTYSNNMSQNI